MTDGKDLHLGAFASDGFVHGFNLRPAVSSLAPIVLMKTAVTVCLVEEARKGPFVLHDGLAAGFQTAKELGYDAVEIFAPGPDAVSRDEVQSQIDEHGLAVAAVGTGAGMVKHGLSLVDPDASKRQQAIDFIKSMIDFGGPFQAPAIIGSMQGKWGGDVSQQQGHDLLVEALKPLGEHAAQYGIPLIYEPLNRYETNHCTTMASGVELLEAVGSEHVVLLADLFHMNIEETTIADGIRDGGKHIGHVHFVDSNRRPAGFGHMDYEPIFAALKEIGYDKYLSVEAFPYPSEREAAAATIEAFNKYA